MTDMLSDLIRPTLKEWENDEIQRRAATITRPRVAHGREVGRQTKPKPAG
jgi:hypothetical protein